MVIKICTVRTYSVVSLTFLCFLLLTGRHVEQYQYICDKLIILISQTLIYSLLCCKQRKLLKLYHQRSSFQKLLRLVVLFFYAAMF